MWGSTENYSRHRWSIWGSCYIQTHDGEKKKQRVERLSRSLLVRGVPVKSVGHEENVGSRRDEGMARFHNLKAQETERTHQFSWKEQAGGSEVTQRREFIHRPKLQQPLKAEPGTYCGLLCSCKSRCRHFQPSGVPQHTPGEQRNWRTNGTTYKNTPQSAEWKHRTTNGPLFAVFRKQDTRHLHKKCVAP